MSWHGGGGNVVDGGLRRQSDISVVGGKIPQIFIEAKLFSGLILSSKLIIDTGKFCIKENPIIKKSLEWEE